MNVRRSEQALRPQTEVERQFRDRELAERAKLGDTEAFGELIQAHREKAKRWAERMTNDSQMADDIVQDALVKAFLHVGSLADTSRFLPWLHTIVRNQANMTLRRGGPFRREQLIGGWESRTREGTDRVDWESVDSILSYLANSQVSLIETDPAEQLVRKELYETIRALLHCLNRKERGMFEASFFRQLSPEEIASMYGTTTATVHTYLHRSRRKLRQTHVRVALDLPPGKGGSGMNRVRVVELPEWSANQIVLHSWVDRIGCMMAALGDWRPISEWMGLTGFAFRMKISNRTTYADGIYVFDWRKVLHEIMRDLGYEANILCGQVSEAPIPLLAAAERFPAVLPIEESVLPFIRKYVDAGKAVLYFDTLAEPPHVHEWALIYGYDDEEKVVYVTDYMRPEGKKLSYRDVADNPLRFLAAINGEKSGETSEERHSQREQAVKTLRLAVRYARKGCDYTPMTGYLSYTSGLAAYDRWIGYLEHSSILPNRYGMGHLAAVYGEAKQHAARYLKTVPLTGEAKRLVLLASEAYEQAAEAMDTISVLLPFIRTTAVLTHDQKQESAKWLAKAKEFESAGIGYLENALSITDQEAHL